MRYAGGVDRNILDETFEDSADGQGDNWMRNWDGDATYQTPELTAFLGPLGKDKVEVVRTLVVPNSAESILFEFDLYEIDNWDSADKIYVRLSNGVENLYLRLKAFSMSTSETATSGYFLKYSGPDKRIPQIILRPETKVENILRF